MIKDECDFIGAKFDFISIWWKECFVTSAALLVNFFEVRVLFTEFSYDR